VNPAPRLLLLTHPGLGEGLLEAAETILGERPPVDLLTNRGLKGNDLDHRLAEWLEAAPGPALILTDLGFGSCCSAARRAAEGNPDIRILAGVNLPVLLAALRSRDHKDLDALITHLAARGAEGVESFGGADN